MNFYVPRVITRQRVRSAGQAAQATPDQVYSVPLEQVPNTPTLTQLPSATGPASVVQGGSSFSPEFIAFIGAGILVIGGLGYYLTRIPEKPVMRTVRARKSRG